jgi:hypothetical protein
MKRDYTFLDVSKSPGEEVLGILQNNVIGTPGVSMTYRHLNVEDKINAIPDPYFVNLKKKDTIIGTCCFCKRLTMNAGRAVTSFYIRYFSFADAYRQKPAAKRSVGTTGVLKQEVMAVLAGQGLEMSVGEKYYHYAYVDPRNIRSMRLCEAFGFEPVRNYATVIFNRLAPKNDMQLGVTEVTSEDEPAVRELLSDFYRDYTMFSFDNLFQGRRYYVIRDAENKIVAGVQANPDRWEVHTLPGLAGKVILNVFSRVPLLKKLFSKDYQFLTLEGVYYAAGCEGQLEVLFESLLARYQLNNAILVVDRESGLYKALKSLKLGLVEKLNKEVTGNVICRFGNLTEEEKGLFKNHPAYISGIDVT